LSTSIFLTDALGSILATFSNTAGSAALLGNQVYSPYGTQRYNKGAMGTNKGFTGQYNDSLTGLDYYNARYYDPVDSVFLSADVAQGNSSGRNPYDYVGGNPETRFPWLTLLANDRPGRNEMCDRPPVHGRSYPLWSPMRTNVRDGAPFLPRSPGSSLLYDHLFIVVNQRWEPHRSIVGVTLAVNLARRAAHWH
jgi:RHS repeat-associated protein